MSQQKYKRKNQRQEPTVQQVIAAVEQQVEQKKKERQPRPPRPKAKDIEYQIADYKRQAGYNPNQVEFYKDWQAGKANAIQISSHLTNQPTRLLKKVALDKVMDQLVKDAGIQGDFRSDPTLFRKLLVTIGGDDWGQLAKSAATFVLPHIWNWAKNTDRGRQIITALKNYAGMDLNDDGAYLGNHFAIDVSQKKNIQWEDMSSQYSSIARGYDGVSTQAIASVLFPELVKSRVPTDIAVRCGLISRTQTFTITTNASGNAILTLHPLAVSSPGISFWYTLYNHSTLDIDSGVQTTVSSPVMGPTNGLTSIVSQRLTATSLEIQPITSSLNNQGRIVVTMNDSSASNSSYSASAAPHGLTTARDQEYVAYSSMAGSIGHRLVYHDSSTADETFVAYGTQTDGDYMQVLVQGAQVSSAVLQVTVSYQIEYTISSNVLVELQMAPAGSATVKALVASLNYNPQLRLIGKQESEQLYQALINCKPDYGSVVSLLTNYRFKHSYSSHQINRFGGVDSSSSPAFSGLSSLEYM